MTPSVRTYDPGTNVKLAVTFLNAAGAPASPSAVVCTVEAPDGTLTTPAVTNDGTGTYHANVTADAPGTWHYSFEGSGTLVARAQWRFLIRRQEA